MLRFSSEFHFLQKYLFLRGTSSNTIIHHFETIVPAKPAGIYNFVWFEFGFCWRVGRLVVARKASRHFKRRTEQINEHIFDYLN